MTVNYANTMLVLINLIDETASVVIANDGHGLILIGDFSQLNEKYV